MGSDGGKVAGRAFDQLAFLDIDEQLELHGFNEVGKSRWERVYRRVAMGLNWDMKTLLMILALGLCLPLAGAEKKADVEKAGYKGRVKSVKVSAFKIEEKEGKQARWL